MGANDGGTQGPIGGGNAADATRGTFTPSSGNTTTHTSGSRSRSKSLTITPRETAYSQIDSEFLKLFGHRASPAIKKAYYKALNAREKKYATRSGSRGGGTTTYDSSGNSSSYSSDVSKSTNYAFDAGLFLQDFVVGYADSELKAGRPLGGVVGQNMASLAQYAADMGISTNTTSLLKDTIAVAKGGADLAAIQNSYRDRAAIKFSAYADLIKSNPGKSLRDLTIDQLDTVAKMIDVNVNNLSFDDSTVNKILSATKDGKGYIMNNAEIQSFVRKNDARFQYGTMAHAEATNLANSFASSFGFGV